MRSRQSSSTATPGPQLRAQRPFLLPGPARANQNEEEVPETPESQLADPSGIAQHPTPLPDNQSQEVEVSNTPKSQLDDCDDTEYSTEEEHKKKMAADEPVATFSPNCQVSHYLPVDLIVTAYIWRQAGNPESQEKTGKNGQNGFY
jgi:hypothetical protein